MTKMRSLVLTIALLASATTACGGGGDGGGGGGEGEGLPPCPIGAIEEGAGPVEITFWHSMTRANEDALKRITADFNSAQDEVKVKLVNQTSYRDTLVKFKSGLSSGDLPDLVQIEDTGLQVMVDSQAVLPAQSCIEADDYDTSDFLERVIGYYSIDDVLWPMPFNVSNPVLYYDKAAFRAAGLDPEDPPGTLEEVKAASRAIVDEGVRPHGIAIKTDAWHLEQMLAKAGEVYVDNDNGRTKRATATAFDSPAGREIFRWLFDMVDSGLAQSTGNSAIDNYFAVGNGNAAMTYDTSAALGTISEILGSGEFAGVELGVGPMPGPEGDGGVLVGGAALYMMRASSPEKQEAAWRYAQYLNRPEVQADWHVSTGYIPTRVSAADSEIVQQRWREKPGFRVAFEQLRTGPENVATAGPVVGDYQGVRDAVVDALTRMFTQGQDPDAALARAAQEGTRRIEAYNERIGG